MATMAYEFVRVEKTPTLLVGSQLAVLTSDCLAPQREAMRPSCSRWMDGGCAHSFEFSNCARTAILGDDGGGNKLNLLCLLSGGLELLGSSAVFSLQGGEDLVENVVKFWEGHQWGFPAESYSSPSACTNQRRAHTTSSRVQRKPTESQHAWRLQYLLAA